MLNNAKRRIDEGKYDDAVARLYRTLELIAQLRLNQSRLIDKENLNKSKSFFVIKDSVDKMANKKEKAELRDKNIAKYRSANKFMNVDLGSSYALLNTLSRDRTDDFSESTQKIVGNFYRVQGVFQKRNTSILAHGLLPINEHIANQLYNLTLKHALLYSDKIENLMKFSRFPLFMEDNYDEELD